MKTSSLLTPPPLVASHDSPSARSLLPCLPYLSLPAPEHLIFPHPLLLHCLPISHTSSLSLPGLPLPNWAPDSSPYSSLESLPYGLPQSPRLPWPPSPTSSVPVWKVRGEGARHDSLGAVCRLGAPLIVIVVYRFVWSITDGLGDHGMSVVRQWKERRERCMWLLMTQPPFRAKSRSRRLC